MKIGSPADQLAHLLNPGASATNGPSKAAQATPAQGSAAGQAGTNPPPATGSATVQMSAAAVALQAGGAAGADMDMEKVARVKAAIEAGTFTINAEVIADKLLTNAQEMLGPKAG